MDLSKPYRSLQAGALRGMGGIVLAALVLAGCGSDSLPVVVPSPDPGAKAGARPGPIILQVADSQPAGRPSNLPLSAFEHEVESRSTGSMQVTIMTLATAEATPSMSDVPVIDRVRNGTYELAVVPARAWSDAGITSLKALQAPFLFESDAQVAAVLNDEVISAKLLAGFDGTDLIGLTLFPEGLRHLFGFGEPILSPADMKGRGIRLIRSADTDAITEALGGIPIEAEDEALTAGVASGAIRGAEGIFFLPVPNIPEAQIATGDVALYAKVDTLVVNRAFWTGLTAAQQSILEDAADATRALAIANVATDRESAARYCEAGGTVVLAGQAAVQEFRAATTGLVDELATDPATAALMTAIAAAGDGLEPESVEACEPPIDQTIEPDGGDLPDGVYRAEYTDDYLRRWGVTNIDFNHGVWTYRLEGGHWTIDTLADNPIPQVRGIYRMKGHDLYWRWDPEAGQPIDHVTWSVERNGDLRFALTPESPEAWTFAMPLIRAGPLD